MRAVNLVLRFVLEICALAALAYGGWHVSGPLWLRLVLAVALPLMAAVAWGRWVAPKAIQPVPDPLRLDPERNVYGGAAIALAATGHPALAAALVVLAAANRIALHLLHTTTAGTPS